MGCSRAGDEHEQLKVAGGAISFVALLMEEFDFTRVVPGCEESTQKTNSNGRSWRRWSSAASGANRSHAACCNKPNMQRFYSSRNLQVGGSFGGRSLVEENRRGGRMGRSPGAGVIVRASGRFPQR